MPIRNSKGVEKDNMAKILVVDDNLDMCQIISDILEEGGHTVNVSYNGEDALRKIKKNHYDLIVLDYRLSGISGLVVLEKALQMMPLLKVIMISAFGSDSTKTKARESGAVDFIDKPFDIKRFVQAVQDILTKKTAEKE